MRQLARTVVVLALAAAPLPAVAASSVADVTDAVIENHIRPGYERLLMETDLLSIALTDLCDAPSDATLADARDDFARVVIAWERVAHIRFGPITEDNRYERIHFWPDRRSIGLRQTQQLLAREDETVLVRGALAGQSVALQGLGALEFVLHGTGAETLADGPARGFRCRYALAIAANLIAVETAVDNDWADPDGYARLLREPGPDNPLYRDEDEILAEYVGTLAHGFEALRDQKLVPVLGETIADASPRQAVFRRAGLTTAAIRAEFAGLGNLFEISGIALLVPKEEQWMGGSALFEFRNVERTLDEIGDDFGAALTDVEGRSKITYLVILSRSLQRLIGENLSEALGLTVGFSALDGD